MSLSFANCRPAHIGTVLLMDGAGGLGQLSRRPSWEIFGKFLATRVSLTFHTFLSFLTANCIAGKIT